MTTQTQQNTLQQLNAAKSCLTAYIIANNPAPGTPEWTKLESVIEQRDAASVQINLIIASTFQPDTAALTAAVAQLTQATQKLTDLEQTLSNINQVLGIADNVVQIATSILTLGTKIP
jgi:glycosyltransferase A (GT-A) superfamily protein (DUF2064 family)